MKDRSTVPDINTLQIIEKTLEIKKNPDPSFREVFAGFSKLQQRLAVRILTKGNRPDETILQMVKDSGYNVNEDSRAAGIMKTISGKMGPLLRAAGIVEADLGATARELLNATTVKVIKKNTYDASGKVTGQEIMAMQVPDNAVRMKVLDMLLKTGDYFTPQKMDVTKKVEGSITFEAGTKQTSIDLLMEREKKLSEPINADYEVVNDG